MKVAGVYTIIVRSRTLFQAYRKSQQWHSNLLSTTQLPIRDPRSFKAASCQAFVLDVFRFQSVQGRHCKCFEPTPRAYAACPIAAIKDHIASSLNIEQDDLEEVPFNTIGGLGRAYELFGDKLAPILDELNMRLAA